MSDQHQNESVSAPGTSTSPQQSSAVESALANRFSMLSVGLGGSTYTIPKAVPARVLEQHAKEIVLYMHQQKWRSHAICWVINFWRQDLDQGGEITEDAVDEYLRSQGLEPISSSGTTGAPAQGEFNLSTLVQGLQRMGITEPEGAGEDKEEEEEKQAIRKLSSIQPGSTLGGAIEDHHHIFGWTVPMIANYLSEEWHFDVNEDEVKGYLESQGIEPYD